MRTSVVVAIASLLLPAGLCAQVVATPRILRPRPGDPAPLPPQADPIARTLAYQRLRISVESYPAVSYVQTSAFAGSSSSAWGTVGAGTRAEYRVSRLASATLDLTSSLYGGPVQLHTAELGTRIHQERSEHGVDPFIDLRVGYLAMSARPLDSFSEAFGLPAISGNSLLQYSHGWGALAGGGVDVGLTRTLSLTAALLAARSRMTSHDAYGPSISDPSFALTSLRLTLGLTYNPVRTLYR
jgi:hypothetical protein